MRGRCYGSDKESKMFVCAYEGLMKKEKKKHGTVFWKGGKRLSFFLSLSLNTFLLYLNVNSFCMCSFCSNICFIIGISGVWERNHRYSFVNEGEEWVINCCCCCPDACPSSVCVLLASCFSLLCVLPCFRICVTVHLSVWVSVCLCVCLCVLTCCSIVLSFSSELAVWILFQCRRVRVIWYVVSVC